MLTLHSHTPTHTVISNCVLDLVKCCAINTWRIKFGMDENRIALSACACALMSSKHVVCLFPVTHWKTIFFLLKRKAPPWEELVKNFSGWNLWAIQPFQDMYTICRQNLFQWFTISLTVKRFLPFWMMTEKARQTTLNVIILDEKKKKYDGCMD